MEDVRTIINRASPSKHLTLLLVIGEYIKASVWRIILHSFRSVPSRRCVHGWPCNGTSPTTSSHPRIPLSGPECANISYPSETHWARLQRYTPGVCHAYAGRSSGHGRSGAVHNSPRPSRSWVSAQNLAGHQLFWHDAIHGNRPSTCFEAEWRIGDQGL